MTLFDSRAAEERASRFIAPGTPTDFGANVSSAFGSTRLSETTIAGDLALRDSYDLYIEQIFQTTGKKLQNPVFDLGSENLTSLRQTGETRPSQDERLNKFFEDVSDLGIEPKTAEELREESLEKVRAAVLENADIAGRAGVAGTLGQFVGGAGAILTDPPVALSMLVGAPVSAGILRTALTEAGIATTIETAIQPSIQSFREEAGLPSGVAEALKNIAFAGVGGGLFAGAIKGGVVGTRALIEASKEIRLTRAQRDAARFLEREVSIRESSPFSPNMPAAQKEHLDRLTRAEIDLKENGPIRVPEEPASAVRPTKVKDVPIPDDLPISEGAIQAGRSFRKDALETVAEREDARRAVEVARQILAIPGVEDLLAVLRARPTPPRTESLVNFLRNRGGLRSNKALNALGVTGRTRPGLVNKRGQTLDDAALDATEAGFFPGKERASINDLLEAIDEEFNRGRPRLKEEDQTVTEEFDQISRGADELERELENLGIDLRSLTDQAALEELQRIASTEIPVSPGVGRAASESRELVAEADRVADQQDLMDDILEAEVRDVFGDDLDQEFSFGEGDEITTLKARDIFDEFERDEELLKNWDDCLKGIT